MVEVLLQSVHLVSGGWEHEHHGCVQVYVWRGVVRGKERERDEETAGVQLNENKQVTSYNALQLVYHKVRVLYSRKLLWEF